MEAMMCSNDHFVASDGGGVSFWKKVVAGAMAGSIGAAIATPTDVLKAWNRTETEAVT